MQLGNIWQYSIYERFNVYDCYVRICLQKFEIEVDKHNNNVVEYYKIGNDQDDNTHFISDNSLNELQIILLNE